MVQQCPNCGVLVGKLHMRCVYCGLYLCEDCIEPIKHYCPAYREGLNYSKHSTKKETTVYSTQFYEKFSTLDDLEEEKISELSEKEREERDKEHVVKQNIAFQQRLRLLGMQNTFDIDACSNFEGTKKKVDIRCVWCGMHFSEDSAEPENHNCSVYQDELKKLGISTKPVEKLVKRNEQELVVTSNNKNICDTYEKSKSLVKLTDKNFGNKGSKVEPKDKTETSKKKVSLWRKLLSIFGFGN